MRADHPQATIVIGVGNRDRGDDAAGPLVADRVERADLGPSVRTVVVEGDLFDLSLRWLPHHDVVIVDAAVTGSAPGTVHCWPGLPPTDGRLLSSHGVPLRDALELGRLLGRTARCIEVIGIEGQSFDLFHEPTGAVARSIDAVADRLVSRFRRTAADRTHRWPGQAE